MLDLPDAFAGYAEYLADFFQGMLLSVNHAEAHRKHLLFFFS